MSPVCSFLSYGKGGFLETLRTHAKAKIKTVGAGAGLKAAGRHHRRLHSLGRNWGYEISSEQREFARGLIDMAVAHVVHGHSSHHVKGIEVYRDRPIIYGYGDFINDYEGIGGYESFRGDLSLMYFVAISPATGRLAGLRMIPTTMKRFRVMRASKAGSEWLRDTLNREGKPCGVRAVMGEDCALDLRWQVGFSPLEKL